MGKRDGGHRFIFCIRVLVVGVAIVVSGMTSPGLSGLADYITLGAGCLILVATGIYSFRSMDSFTFNR